MTTPSPSVGDLWEWTLDGRVFLLMLRREIGRPSFDAWDLTNCKEDVVLFHETNSIYWRFKA